MHEWTVYYKINNIHVENRFWNIARNRNRNAVIIFFYFFFENQTQVIIHLG